MSILKNGINTEGRPTAGLDWSRSEVIVNVKDKPIAKFKTLAEAAPHYKGYVWALETTADSYELQKRQIDLDAIKVADIRAYCSNSKYTSLYRIKWEDIPKSDEADSEVIRRIFVETGLPWSRFKQIVKEDNLRKDIKKELVEDRYLFDGDRSVEVARKYLPPYTEVPEHLREFLYEPATIKAKKPKNPTPKKQIGRLLMAAQKVREAGRGWRMFRRQVGNYGQGYACMLRSEYYWWLVRVIVNSQMKKLGLKKTIKTSHIDPKTKKEMGMRIWTPEEIKVKKEVMQNMHDVLKWLWKLTI